MRIGLGIIVGIVLAFCLQAGADVVANMIYPAAITDAWDAAQVREAFAARPTGALLITVFGFFIAALGGGVAARRIALRNWPVWIPGGVILLMGVTILLAYPLPGWMWAGSVLAPLLGAFAARHLGADPEPRIERADEGL